MDKSRQLHTRDLQSSDYNKDYFLLLNQLTFAPKPEYETFLEHVSTLQQDRFRYVFVVEDELVGKIVASVTLLIEPKFIHGCSAVGHIEDLVVHKEYRGLGLAKGLVQRCVRVCEKENCYKVILNCDKANCSFYQKLGFVEKDLQMCLRFDVG